MNEAGTHYRWSGEELTLRLRITPRSSADQVLGLMADRLKVAITAPPVDGKANAHLVKFLSKQFGVAKSQVMLVSGETGRDKTVCIVAPTKLPEVFGVVPA
ncbi:MAG: DUF167 family protein [Planctomycetaceae bacterium]